MFIAKKYGDYEDRGRRISYTDSGVWRSNREFEIEEWEREGNGEKESK